MIDIYTDTYGVLINFETDVDLTSATDAQVIIKKPNREIVTKDSAVSITDPAKGIVSYAVEQGDFSIVGEHELQVVTLEGVVKKLRGTTITVNVKQALG